MANKYNASLFNYLLIRIHKYEFTMTEFSQKNLNNNKMIIRKPHEIRSYFSERDEYIKKRGRMSVDLKNHE